MKLINIIILTLLTLTFGTSNLSAKSQEVYLLPSIGGEPSKVVPAEKDWSRWLIQYDGGTSPYYLSGLLPGDTLGVYFIPPAGCYLIEVHFCRYKWCEDSPDIYYAFVADVPDGVTLDSYEEYHSYTSLPGQSPIGDYFVGSTVMDLPYTGDWHWDTLVVPGTPYIGMNAFWAGYTIEDTCHSTRIDAGVDPPYHAICWKQGGAGPETNGPGWYASWHLFWARALVECYPIFLYVEVEQLLGSYDPGNRTVHIYTEDYSPDTATLGIDEIYLYYFVEDGTDTMKASVVQDSVYDIFPNHEYSWWHAVIPSQPAGTRVTYWVEATDYQGIVSCSDIHSYMIGSGTDNFGLLYIESDENWGNGIHDAFAGFPWDFWYETTDGIADNTVTDFYITGDGAREFAWLSFSGYKFAEWTFTDEFSNFIDIGGGILVAGQDIPGGGYGLGYGEWVAPPSPYPLRDYLMAFEGTDDYIGVSPFSVFVDATDVVTLGMAEELVVDCAIAMQSTWVGIFTDLDPGCVPLFFDGEGNILGYRYESAKGFRVIFLYFPFHAITTTEDQDTFIENATFWLWFPGVEENPGELTYELPMVIPNPLSRPTTINFTIPRSEHVSVNLYDITGSLVSTLVNKELTAGTHSITINTDNLVSGVYFLKTDAGAFCHTAKFLVVK
ncbi:T9SS type A sorting domain-containing protein [candidate division WOR-3 bacterium]|nr:T9SS type A sorting domain-containing protein [candidate division WOR-3 bacterium]MCK4329929.1 T9SS type A sorting domain-containing protein [candidate division WOR-3 bacterium]